jgi:ferrochelatase
LAGRNKDTIGVVLLNLGGPDSLSAVRPFLYNLFSDRDIIKLGPPFLQKPMAWLISSLRSKKTKKMYGLIGGKSPILDITMAQAEALEKSLNSSLVTRHSSLSFKVCVGMRYWHPFIMDTVEKILKDGVKSLIVLSLYPHYSKATTGSAIAEFKNAIARLTPHASRLMIQYIEQWYDFPPYIDSLAELIYSGISEFDEKDVDVLFSAHSLPEDSIKKGDPYLDHIKATITAVNLLLATRYSLPCRWHLSFQSRGGPVRWLQPATDETIIKLSKAGSKNLFVVPISFVSDHIETLYEIDILYKEIAMRYGINFKRCQSLNTSEKFIDALRELVLRETQISTDRKSTD